MNSSFLFRCIILITSSLLVISCATTTENTEVIQPTEPKLTKINNDNNAFKDALNNAQQLQQNKQWPAALSAWKEVAKISPPEQQAHYANNAALMLFRLKQQSIIPSFYESLDYQFTDQQAITNKNVLLAATYFDNGKTYQSLSTLPDINLITDQSFLKIALNVRANAILNIGKPLASAKIRIQLVPLLSDPEQSDANFLALWDAIERLSDNIIIKTLKNPQENELRGWLELSLIARRSNMIPATIEPWLQQWHITYPTHSGFSFAIQLLEQSKNITINPTKIALMLPINSKLAKVSKAIQDGFLYAHYESNRLNPNKTLLEIDIISLDPNIPFTSQYKAAIENGADFIVGPLNKKSVTELATLATLDVPTLALNYSEHESFTQNLFHFGLKPEDEAEQVADYALLDNKYNAATLIPDTTWGKRLNLAFKQRYELLGGTVQSEAKYPSKSNDYGLAIKNLLNLTQSKLRHSAIQTVIGEKLEYQPRRRQDIDMIFIGANARQARIIKPQLKFHYANKIQVFGTSHIASSNANKSADRDRDLNGVYYVDMPWTLKGDTFQETKDIQRHWPSLYKSHGKLFALGIDAYRIIPQLKRLMLHSEESYQGLTGNLTVDKQGRIHRELLLATYKKGKQLEITNEINE